jgi:hypothetical protein
MGRIRRHLTFANVASAIALFVAVSGGTAVALNGSNTVFTDDVANDTQPAGGGNPAGGLAAADLRPNSVGTSEVQNGSIGPADVSRPAANVVKRLRGGPFGTGDGFPTATLAAWTQKANEVETLAGEVTYEIPDSSACATDQNHEGGASLIARVDGDVTQVSGVSNIGGQFGTPGSPGDLVTLPIGFEGRTVFEPGADTQHTLELTLSDGCLNPGDEWTITSVKVDVIGFR